MMAATQIETRERTNKSGKTYAQYFSDGKMVGCGCDEAKAVSVEKYHFKPCSHMRAVKTPVIQVQSYSCELCGRSTRGAFAVCWVCAGA